MKTFELTEVNKMREERDVADAISSGWKAADYENYEVLVGDHKNYDNLLSDYQMYENLRAGKNGSQYHDSFYLKVADKSWQNNNQQGRL